MIKRKLEIIILLLCLCLLPSRVHAAPATDVKAPISPEADCSLTVHYRTDGTAFPGQLVNLYKIADVSADFQYTPTTDFASAGLALNGIQTTGEWNVIRTTLESHILAEGLKPDLSTTTNHDGTACFDALKPGLYLAVADIAVLDSWVYSFDAALIALPGLGTDGLWQYQVSATAKYQAIPPVIPDDVLQLKVIKLWKGDENQTSRPRSIEVEIFCNGVSFQLATLSADNNWSYTWAVPDDGASWKVVERNIPAGYTVTVEERNTTFVLTNTFTPDSPDDPSTPPKTGDSSHILLYIVLMYISGSMLIILGLIGKRKRT